jgi:hypothetical protein
MKKKTNSKNNKKNKIKKPKTTERNREERESEIKTLQNKLEELQLGPHSIPEVNDFFEQEVKRYVEEGIPASGSFPLVGCKRVLHYHLTVKKMHQVTIDLKFNDNI